VTLTADDMIALERLVRRIVRDEVANVNRSRGSSPAGITAPVEGDRCVPTNRGSMDPTSTETSGASTSLQDAEEDVFRNPDIDDRANRYYRNPMTTTTQLGSDEFLAGIEPSPVAM
jgi:hypothetical protein